MRVCVQQLDISLPSSLVIRLLTAWIHGWSGHHNHHQRPGKSLALDEELSAPLSKGAIEEVNPLLQPRGCYSPHFLVPKTTDRFRPILDLRGLNRVLKVPLFHLLMVAEVLKSIYKGEWFTSVDLKNACFHVPIFHFSSTQAVP